MTTTELITSGNAGRFAIPSEADLQAVYGVATEALAEMKTRLIVPDTNTPGGYKLAVAGIRECRELRGSIEAKRKELKADSLAYGKAVDKVARFLTEEIESIEEPIKAAKKEVDDRLERERLEAERKANEERLAAERARREEEERKLAEERAKLEAERKAMEEAQRIERERLEAERKAIEAEQRRQRALLEEEQRKALEWREAEARKLADERAAVEAEQRRQEESERQRLAELERQRQEAEAAERAKQEAAEREARRVAALPEAEKLKAWLLRIRDAVESGPDTSELIVFLHDYNDCYHSIHNRQAAFCEHIDAVTKGGAE